MASGLYTADQFKDNCGFGLIAHTKGNVSHKLLKSAINSLACMTHRGGIAADGKTGDGCGLLIQKPDGFLRTIAQQQGIALPNRYAVGSLFMDTHEPTYLKQRIQIEEAVKKQGLTVLGFRVVATDKRFLGPMALANLPRFEHLFVAPSADLSAKSFAVKLYLARRLIEKSLVDYPDFYIASLSETVLSYKGLVMPVDLPKFFIDLADPRMKTAICVFHQRFSTNTQPRWPLAQPFRLLAHNGEINTISGNRSWANARSHILTSNLLPNLDQLSPIVNSEGSDSSSMDNMLELLMIGGMDLFRALRLMIPPAWQNVGTINADLRAFYEYHSMHMEPWDGPAGLVITDGRYAICALDRNGLRPSRWMHTKDGFMTVASEAGVNPYPAEEIINKGRVGPGQLLVIDTQTGHILHSDDIDQHLQSRHPYRSWLKKSATRIEARLALENFADPILKSDSALRIHQKLHLISFEERDQIIRPLCEHAQEATGSMGDDTPIAVLSQKIRPITDYFRQQFAQVTNPPIDPLRESIVMSLETYIGPAANIFQETQAHANRLILSTPILSPLKFNGLKTTRTDEFKHLYLSLAFQQSLSLPDAIKQLIAQAEQAAKDQYVIIVLSDRQVEKDQLLIPSAMATGAVHNHLIQKGLRCYTNLIIETGDVRDAHQFAVLIGLGATAIYPWLVYEVIEDLNKSQELLGDPLNLRRNYRRGINKGLMKILSKMGISTIASYRGAQLFELIGLNKEIVDLCFPDMTQRIEGAGFTQIKEDLIQINRYAFSTRKPLSTGGLLKYMHNGEYHSYNPDVITQIQHAVQANNPLAYQRFADLVNNRPVATLRDLLVFRSDLKPIAIDEVEPAEALFARFDTAAMSLGALSPEAHKALAKAMNTLGGRSNSGEGGEDPKRYGTEYNSKIKQIASGRFGVTPHYLSNADVLQIKVAQGAKPGEGGQLPGGKVNQMIATLRYSVPGVTLISPPPHHDIYSIEDLAQLIFDLKQINPTALVSVKLVSEPGIGTIASGVAKAYADLITVSGYDGGTAASPLTSIKHAGSPWELGLAEVHQALRINDLRGKIRLQTDGGLKTGLDVIKAAILGAESFGFGTMPMVAVGCKYLRICHLNNCATGVATQQEELRDEHYIGTADMVINYFRFVAEETRQWLAKLGVRSLQDIIGRTDLLTQVNGDTAKQQQLDLSNLLHNPHITQDKPQYVQQSQNKPYDQGVLAEKMVACCLPAIEEKTSATFAFNVTNCDRSIGARLSGEIAKRYGNEGLKETPLTLNLTGSAGQSFGVWNVGGLNMTLEGEANDYVGKGMTGGKLVVFSPKKACFPSQDATLIGNTCLYGATGGKLLVSGKAGERFAVRNSGAHAVIEGVGDHCCEYMTGGMVCVLGETGYNFAAGMTGGFAYVLDQNNTFVDQYNHELVDIHRIINQPTEMYRFHLRHVIQEFINETHSQWAQTILDDFTRYIQRFWLVKPKASNLQQLLNITGSSPE